jgi:hypothetical protein
MWGAVIGRFDGKMAKSHLKNEEPIYMVVTLLKVVKNGTTNVSIACSSIYICMHRFSLFYLSPVANNKVFRSFVKPSRISCIHHHQVVMMIPMQLIIGMEPISSSSVECVTRDAADETLLLVLKSTVVSPASSSDDEPGLMSAGGVSIRIGRDGTVGGNDKG